MIYDNKFPIKLLKSNLNEVYLGIELSANVIETYLNTFREIVGEEKYHLFTSKRKERDGDMYHITVTRV
jgi:hypothetical protein